VSVTTGTGQETAATQVNRGLPLGRLVRALPALVTGAVAALTLAGVVAAYVQARHDAYTRRAGLATDIRAQTVDTMNATIKRTDDLATGLGAGWPAHRAIFTSIASGLLRSPGINGVGLIERVSSARRAGFERRYGPIEAHTATGALHRAPASRYYLVVVSSVQGAQGPSSIGLDIGDEPSRRATLLAAAASGQPSATPPVKLMTTGKSGTVLYTPIYGSSKARARTPAQRARLLLGFVSTSYRYDLLLRILRRTIPSGAFSLSDGPTRLLAQGTPRRATAIPISIAGRAWTLTVGAPAPDLSLPTTILLAGGLLTLLIGTIGVQAKRRERYAQELVARRLAEREVAERALAQAEERFRTAFAEAPIGMALTSLEGRFLQVNKALTQISGYDERQLLDDRGLAVRCERQASVYRPRPQPRG